MKPRTLPLESNGQAISYLRWSSEQQSKGDSLRRQLEASEAYCTQHGLDLNSSLRDEGISAYDKSNLQGAFGTFLTAVRNGTITPGTTLIVESLDRLSRAKPIDALQVFLEILNAGILIVTLTDEQLYTRNTVTDDFSKLIISIVIMQRAHEESATKSMRVGAAWDKKLQNVIDKGTLLTRNTPKWMRVVDDKLELIPERVATVKRIFQMSKDGIGQHTIVRTLNGDTPAWSSTGTWQQSYIGKMMNNPAVYGAIEVKNQLVENYYPPILSKDEFLYIKGLRSGRRNTLNSGSRKGKTVSNLFSGLCFCGYCNAKMQMSGYTETRFGKHKSTPRLLCYGARSAATKCQCINWPYDDFEELFLFMASQLDLKTLFGIGTNTKKQEIEKRIIALTGEIDDTNRKLKNLYVAIQEDPLPGLVKLIKELDAKLVVLEKQKQAALQDVSKEQLAQTSGKARQQSLLMLFKALNTTDTDKLRQLREMLQDQIHSIVEKIEVFPSGPSMNRKETAMRFMRVHFKSDVVKEFARS